MKNLKRLSLLFLTVFMFGYGYGQTPFYTVIGQNGMGTGYQFDDDESDFEFSVVPDNKLTWSGAYQILYSDDSFEVTYTIDLSEVQDSVGNDFPDGIGGNIDLELYYELPNSLNGDDYIYRVELLNDNDDTLDFWQHEDYDDQLGLLPHTNDDTGTLTTEDLDMNSIIKLKVYSETFGTSGEVHFGKIELTDLTDYSTVDVSENKVEDTFTIYSFDNTIKVTSNELSPYDLKVYNMSGQVVFETSTSGDIQHELHNSGVYIVSLQIGNGVVREKVFVE